MKIYIPQCQPKNTPPTDIYSYSYCKEEFLKNRSDTFDKYIKLFKVKNQLEYQKG